MVIRIPDSAFAYAAPPTSPIPAYARYQSARSEAEALALIRGKDAEAIEAAQANWQGNPEFFAAAQAKDAAERRRDPLGYVLTAVPGLAQAMEETPKAERGALLWSAQEKLGLASLSEGVFQLLQANSQLNPAQASVDPKLFRLGADGKFGMQSLRAVQLIAQDEAARRLLLDAIAERRTQWHLDHPERYPGDPTYDTEKRYPHFRFQ